MYGLTFDAGAFLNISPDHISAIEHPTFEDYLYCKRQITHNCRTLVLGADCDHADLIRQDAQASNVPVTTFALHAADGHGTHADFVALPDASSGYLFQEQGKAIGDFSLELEGEFNAANAAAAIALSRAVGVPAGS